MPQHKAQKIVRWLQVQIQDKKLLPLQRLPTEGELCTQFGLSRNAVRNALGQLAQQGWLDYVKNRGYFVPQNIPLHSAGGRIQNIGLLCFFPGRYIFPDIISGVNTIVQHIDYNIILRQSEYQVAQERKALEQFAEQKVCGLIAEPIFDGETAPNHKFYAQIAAQGVPVVFSDAQVPQIRASSIVCCDSLAGWSAAQHFLKAGYRDFILFFQQDYLAKAQRIQGAREALQAEPSRPKICWRELAFLGQGPHSDAPKKCEDFFCTLKPPTKSTVPMAWLCSSDEDAAIVVEVARRYRWELHRDYELIGFDNSQLSQLIGGGFSSFTHPGRLMGRMAARFLLDQIAEEPASRHICQILVESNFTQRNFYSFSELQERRSRHRKEYI